MPSAHQSDEIFEMRSLRIDHQHAAYLNPARAFVVCSGVITNGEKLSFAAATHQARLKPALAACHLPIYPKIGLTAAFSQRYPTS
jgi:hypothetical protein